MENNTKKTLQAHIAILTANMIFGLGVPVTKFLLDDWVTPMTYMAFRCVGATLIFWAIAMFLPKEPVKRRDLLVIMAGGLLGFVISQTLTAWALQFTTPVYFSLIATLTPIATMLMAALFLGERITRLKTVGVLLAIVGAALMVIVRWQSGTGSNDLLGIALAILSVLTWVVYLLITRKVSQAYSAVTQMKWIFLVSSVAVLPFAVGDIPQTRLLTDFSPSMDWFYGASAMFFIVVFATVLGYFMIPYAMQYLKATTVSIYTNLQPVVASLIAIAIGQDILTWDKPVAAILVLLGVFLVTGWTTKRTTQ
ncbi:MAG: DMT family transporter [Prevotella sp.]|nr:DMT family transporter [Prevotella sp.]